MIEPVIQDVHDKLGGCVGIPLYVAGVIPDDIQPPYLYYQVISGKYNQGHWVRFRNNNYAYQKVIWYTLWGGDDHVNVKEASLDKFMMLGGRVENFFLNDLNFGAGLGRRMEEITHEPVNPTGSDFIYLQRWAVEYNYYKTKVACLEAPVEGEIRTVNHDILER